MALVIIDRDGVINYDSDDYIKSLAEWRPIPGSLEAIARLSQAGFTVAVATNQSGLARGLFQLEDLESINESMIEKVHQLGGDIAGIFYCPHHPDDRCECRKPKPGLISAIEEELGLSAEGAYLIGDSLKDLQAGLAKACKPVLVKTGKGEGTLQALPDNMRETVPVFDDLAAATDYIIGQSA
ncbi:D-glycero-beta-D-manno-heptose 1,7-bisphosphate 7-phosphatase [Proteobacteria bacterium 005FR1]|nr:D-glycero-beta-D-manno-heptose 1,7-bisphosphate 7-phosphatase [Proteobacteria bacterium 005FR1]